MAEEPSPTGADIVANSESQSISAPDSIEKRGETPIAQEGTENCDQKEEEPIYARAQGNDGLEITKEPVEKESEPVVRSDDPEREEGSDEEEPVAKSAEQLDQELGSKEASLSREPDQTSLPVQPAQSSRTDTNLPSRDQSGPLPALPALPVPNNTATSRIKSTNSTATNWGGFLNKAVANIESQLDRVLQEPDSTRINNRRPTASQTKSRTASPPASPQRISRSTTPTLASASAPSRLSMQDRLAAAMNKKKADQSSQQSQYSQPNRTRSQAESQRLSRQQSQDTPVRPDTPNTSDPVEPVKEVGGDKTAEPVAVTEKPLPVPVSQINASVNSNTFDASENLERIRILEEKFKFLVDEVASSNLKISKGEVDADAREKRLAEKDEKIALLMQEGITLSKTELKNMNTIKKLRASNAESEKAVTDLKASISRLEKDLQDGKEKFKRFGDNEKSLNERLKSSSKLQSAVDSLRHERDGAQATVEQLVHEIKSLKLQRDEETLKAQTEALDRERAAHVQTKTSLEAIQTDLRMQINRLEEVGRTSAQTVERERAANRKQTLQSQTEIQALESKLEAIRSQAEEMTSAASVDTQARQLRQIERLQSQHWQAQESWQVLESSLLSRIDGLEKERQWLVSRQRNDHTQISSLQTRVRDGEQEVSQLQTKANEDAHKLDSLQIELDEVKSQFAKKCEELQTAFEQSKSEKDEMNAKFEADMEARLGKEKEKWEESGLHPMETFSRRSSGALFGLHGYRTRSSRMSLPNFQNSFGVGGQDIIPSRSTPPPIMNLPSPMPEEDWWGGSNHESGDDNGGLKSPPTGRDLASPGHSTPAAVREPSIHVRDSSVYGDGPNVSMIERLSAWVRRLESDMTIARDEIGNLQRQNREIQEDCTRLTSEAQLKQDFEQKYIEKDAEMQKLDARYQQSLELLGEKTEQVEEMRLDVQDLKQALREALQDLAQHSNK